MAALTRRRFVLALAASAAAACLPKRRDPEGLVGPPALQDRLKAYTALVRAGRWREALAFFDEEHRSFQAKIYFDPEYNEVPPDPDDPQEQKRFLTWYLLEAMALREPRLFDQGLRAVRDIRFTELLTPFGEDGPYRILLIAETDGDPVEGWLLVDRDSLAFFGSAG